MPSDSLLEALHESLERTFTALPDEVRVSLVEYWQTLRKCERPTLGIKTVLYAKPKPPFTAKRPLESYGAFAMRKLNYLESLKWIPLSNAQCFGDSIIFRKKFVSEAPPNVLDIVMAEELAHAYQAAPTGKRYPEAAIGRQEEELEKEAKALATSWNFPIQEAEDWCSKHLH